jgi:hypothetical protein
LPTRRCSPSNAPSTPRIPCWPPNVARKAHRPLLLSTERLATQLLEATSQTVGFLREYRNSVLFDLQDLDDDPVDPF